MSRFNGRKQVDVAIMSPPMPKVMTKAKRISRVARIEDPCQGSTPRSKRNRDVDCEEGDRYLPIQIGIVSGRALSAVLPLSSSRAAPAN